MKISNKKVKKSEINNLVNHNRWIRFSTIDLIPLNDYRYLILLFKYNTSFLNFLFYCCEFNLGFGLLT